MIAATSTIKHRVDRLMLDTSFGFDKDGWIAMVKPSGDQAFFGRGDTPEKAGEQLELALKQAVEHGEIHA